MKKLILILLLSIVLYSCAPKPGEQNVTGVSFDSKLRYFKDPKTNNCFIERGKSSTYSFVCVKCDSLFEKAFIEQYNK